MAEKSILGFAFSALTGAVAATAGYYALKKVKSYFGKKPKMKIFEEEMQLSTRCTWLIAELGAEADFNLDPGHMPLALTFQDGRPKEFFSLQDKSICEEINLQLMRCGSSTSEEDSGIADDEMMPLYPEDRAAALVVDDDFTMLEGAAMCMFLADKYGRFLPEQHQKAEYYRWIVYSSSTFDNIMKTLQQQLVDLPEEEQNPSVIHSALNGYHAFARALSETLQDRMYICGDEFTAADCVLGFTLWWAYTIDQTLLEEYASLRAYLHRLRRRPAFRRTFGEEDNWMRGRSGYRELRALMLKH